MTTALSSPLRAAGRERVGGRAGRRRKYEAVGEEERQRLAADLYLKVRDARDAALRYYEVVQRVELVDEPAGAPDLPFEQVAALERVMARYYRFYILFGGFGAAYREEAEPPEVDAVERYRVAEGVARGAQESSVAAEDYREGRLFAPRLVVDARDGYG